MKRKHYLAWMLTAALTAASVMPMTVYAQPASAGGGKVKLRNVLADKVIDLVGMRVDNGTQAQIWQDVFGENQLWKLDPVPARLLDKEPPAPKPGTRKAAPKTTRTQTEKKTSGKAARRTSKNK